MISEEEFPDYFRDTILHMIWKQKGPAEILKNNRFIHMKPYLPRTCEALVVGQMKEDILKMSSIYQVGGQPGHSPEELIFVMKSLMGVQEFRGEGLILLLVDIIQFFDKEDIFDVMQVLNDIGVNKKAARVWFKLNQGTRVSVKTAAGMTPAAEAGIDCIGQGTAGGALLSQLNLDYGLNQYFSGSSDETYYGQVRIQPVAYQDDVARASKSVLEVQAGNTKMSAMLQDKGLEAHPDKTCFIVMGSNDFKAKVYEDLKKCPLTFGKFELKEKEADKYLGQMLHSGGLGTSAEATVEERTGRIKGAAMEIKAIIEEFQTQAMGGLMVAWELWERAMIPSLLSGAGTWTGNIAKAVEMADKIQEFYWRVILKVPESCPKLALRCEPRQLGMKWRIWIEKMLLLKRIQKQDEGSLCHQVYEEGKSMGWPGLWQEVAEICKEVKIPDINDCDVPARDIKEAVTDHHGKCMTDELMKSEGKLKNIKFDNFKQVQGYFEDKSVDNGRMAFKIRTQMLPGIPGNFKNKYKKKDDQNPDKGLLCDFCQDEEILSQSHCAVCPAWEEQRRGLNLSKVEDLVIFFRKMLLEKEKREQNQVNGPSAGLSAAMHDS